MRILLAAVVYFLAVMAAGFVCGVVRVLVVAPAIGPFAAVACEAPIMIVAMVVAARFVSRRFGLDTCSDGVIAGLVALLFTMVAELGGAMWLRNLSVSDYLASLTTPEGLLSLGMFALFAGMPPVFSAHRRVVPAPSNKPTRGSS